jgi:hypothetical protein
LTGAVELALRLAEGELTYADLVTGLGQRFPHAGAEKIRRLLAQLWELNVLIGDVSPPNSNPHPELHLVKRLAGPHALTTVQEGFCTTGAISSACTSARRIGDSVATIPESSTFNAEYGGSGGDTVHAEVEHFLESLNAG